MLNRRHAADQVEVHVWIRKRMDVSPIEANLVAAE
jgi:hypothetical protein